MLLISPNSVFTVDETHGRVLRAGNRLIANSQDAGWRSLHAAIIEEGPFTATEPAIGHPMLEQLAIAITTALRDGTAEDGLYIDTLAQMMAVHLARTHSAQSRPGRMPTMQAMSGWRMRRVIEYIEENLDGDLSLEAMAAEVDITPIYLARAFKAAVGQSPHRYVLARRIERAKELLRNSEMAVVDVALSSGFSSQSHLSYWFQRYVGVSPAAYRQHRAL